MKITKIERNGDIFTVTKEPNFFEKIVAIVKRKERYKKLDANYKNYPWLVSFRREDGVLMGARTKIVEKLNKELNKF